MGVHCDEGVMGGWVGSHRGTIRGSVPLSHSPLGGLLSPSLGLVGRWGRGHLNDACAEGRASLPLRQDPHLQALLRSPGPLS